MITSASRVAVVALAVAACKSRTEREREAPTAPVQRPDDAARADDASPGGAWPELADLPVATPLRTIVLPTRSGVPRFDVGGPVIAGEVAVVASSQLGFAAVDWRRGTVVWTKPAGAHVAPPAIIGDSVVLIGDCTSPLGVPDGELLIGCVRIVTAAGRDEAYLGIHGPARALEAFAGSPGAQHVIVEADDRVRWIRGEVAVRVDLRTGLASTAPATTPPIEIEHRGRRRSITREEDRLVIRDGTREVWRTEHDIGPLLGAVWIPGQTPMIRYAIISARSGRPVLRLLDVDALGSGHGQAALSAAPGIQLLGQAISPVGDVALAVRLDTSLKRDYVVAFAANALPIWVHPLPEVMRADPVGVAIALDAERAPEAVVVFHDGDLVTVLPPVSSPPTAPGAARGPSGNATP